MILLIEKLKAYGDFRIKLSSIYTHQIIFNRHINAKMPINSSKIF